MDFIDALIKKLEEAKEELSKNMNCAPGAMLEKDAANSALAPKEVKVKKLQAQIDSGTYKPDPKKIAEKMIQKEEDPELEKNNRNRGKQQEQAAGHEFARLMEGKRHSDEMDRQVKANAISPVKHISPVGYKPQVKMLKEELTCSENGQWNLKTTDK